jgi:hypothetical protein
MYLIDGFWTSITFVVSFLTLSPVQGPSGKEQAPLLTSSDALHHENLRGPIFKPPGGRLTGPGSNFTCDYTNMPGWSNCSTPSNRGCWLRNDKTGEEFNISTDYEDTNQTPIGIHRTYYLNITDGSYNADGLDFTQAKLFNGTYPGPWIQACWGDVRICFSNAMYFCCHTFEICYIILTILTECHNHRQQHTQEQWHQCSLARHSAMEDYGKFVCSFKRSVGLATLWPNPSF